MKFGPTLIEQTEGKILAHNIAGGWKKRLPEMGNPYLQRRCHNFMPVHNLASLEDLADRLRSLSDSRPIRRPRSEKAEEPGE